MQVTKDESSGSDKKEIKFTVDGEKNAFANALRGALVENGSVSFAAAKQEHPLTEKVVVLVKVSKGSAKDAVIDAAAKLARQSREFGKKFGEEYK